MIAVSDIPEDELLLARLECGKLAKLLGGMLSVGLSSLQLDSPDTFLVGRNKLILAMVEVLCHAGVKPGSDSAIDLNERTTHLAKTVDYFFSYLMTLARWRSMTKHEVQLTSERLAIAYSEALAILRELQQAFNYEVDYDQQQMKGEAMIHCAVTELSKRL